MTETVSTYQNASLSSRLHEVQEPQPGPNENMSASGFFLGMISMLGGGAVGSQFGLSSCANGDNECVSRHTYTGALIAGTLAIPLGVHMVSLHPKNLPLSLLLSGVAGTAIYAAMHAVPGSPIAMAPLVALPIQVVTSVKMENRK